MLKRKLKSLLNLSFHFWPHRNHFPSKFDLIKASVLRILSARSIRGYLNHTNWRLRFGSARNSVFLRVGTEDIIIFEEIFLNEEYGQAAEHLNSNSVVVDLGGNIGLACKYFEERYRPKLMIAAEPDSSNLSLFRINNANAIESGRLVTHQCFAAGSPGKAAINRKATQPAGYRMANDDEVDSMQGTAEFIECLTMENLIEKHQLTKIDLLKCDIEGAEAEIFENCSGWINLVRRLVVETHHPYTPEDLLKHLSTANVDLEVQSIFRRGDFAVVTANITSAEPQDTTLTLDSKVSPNA